MHQSQNELLYELPVLFSSVFQPERISGKAYGNKCDIWSLGVVLLECATGKFPYTPPENMKGWTSMYELVDAIVENPPPRAPSHLFSPEFCSFISQWLDIFFQTVSRYVSVTSRLLKWCFYDSCSIQKDPRDRKSAKELLVSNHTRRVTLSSFFL